MPQSAPHQSKILLGLVEALLNPALLFPDLLAEADVVLDFPELLVFSDFDPLPDLPVSSHFQPLLFEDLAQVVGLGDSVGYGDKVGDNMGPEDSVGPEDTVGVSVGYSVG